MPSAAAPTRLLALLLLGLLVACGGPREERYDRPASAAPSLQLDHAWIGVSDSAAARAMMEEAGFRLPGGGAARIAFENGYFELNPAAGPGRFGIGFRRTAATPAALPFDAGSGPASMVSLAVAQQGVDEAANRAIVTAGGPAAEPFLHGNGARRLTGVRVTAPTRAALPAGASFVNLSGAAEFRVGTEWVMELELDHGTQNQEIDLRPRLPLVIRL